VKDPQSRQAELIEPEDMALFRDTVGDVNPLAQQNRIFPSKPPRKPLLGQARTPPKIPDNLSDFVNQDAPEEYLSNGLSRMTLRKLRRGGWPVQDRLDLHGLYSESARRLLIEFLHNATHRHYRCVLVIHGKGLNSRGGEAVLRKLARHWLTQHPNVLGFCSASPADGGSGAVLVLLKASS
jgi:DNA-nicking Smr family endonuclease